jgi:hypothetical protein
MNTSIKMKFLAAAILALAASASHAFPRSSDKYCVVEPVYSLGDEIVPDSRKCETGRITVWNYGRYTIYATAQQRLGPIYPWRNSKFSFRWVRENGLRDSYGSFTHHTGSASRAIIQDRDRHARVWGQATISFLDAGWDDSKMYVKIDTNDSPQ